MTRPPTKIESFIFAAAANAAACRDFLSLTIDPSVSIRQAAQIVGKPVSFFCGADSMLARFEREGENAFMPEGRDTSAMIQFHVPPWFVKAARFFYMMSNLRRCTGSVPEAVLRVIELPKLPLGWTKGHGERLLTFLRLENLPACPAELREEILRRHNARKPLIPRRLARQIAASASILHSARSPRDWKLQTLSAPGSQRRFFNAATGQREIMQPGDWFGGDDATPGIAVCVSSNEVRTPSSEKFGVLIGRFQWLAFIDCRTDKLLAFEYIVRPRGSYRAEDVVRGMKTVTIAHGVPRRGWQFEGGTWDAKLVRHAVTLLGCQHWRTYSPHQKAIESIFNRVWTRLAVQFPHADLGRYRAENEINCKIYESCKKGQKDPRQFFPSLATLVKVFEEEISFHNGRRIVSHQYGSWVPDEFFNSYVAENPLREFGRTNDWIFSPWAVERKIHGMLVRCRVPMFEDFSVPFEFSAPWMPLHRGKLVRVHFDPREPKCRAKIVLLENSGTHKAGDILGDAKLIGETAQHIRLIMAWANDDQRAGYIARQRTAHFAHRISRGFGHSGRVQYSAEEIRDGLGHVARIERDPRPVEPQPPAVNSPADIPVDLADISQARNGKIARLPRPVREEVCKRLDDGQPGPVILTWLNDLPEVRQTLSIYFESRSVNAQNLTEWRQGGYKEWLATNTEALVNARLIEEKRVELNALQRKARSEELRTFALAQQHRLD